MFPEAMSQDNLITTNKKKVEEIVFFNHRHLALNSTPREFRGNSGFGSYYKLTTL